MMSGHTFGVLLSSPRQRLTPISRDTEWFMQHLSGSGIRHVKINTGFFFWLLSKDCLSTRALLKRRNMILPDYNCVCCANQVEESSEHLFIHCPFAQSCWATLGIQVGQDDPFSTLEQIKLQLNVPFFMEIIILMCWWFLEEFNPQLLQVFFISRRNLP